MIMYKDDLRNDDYVGFNAAVALKKIGFNVATHTHYHNHNGQILIGVSSNPETWIDYSNVIDRPILQKAVEWLRERFNISLRINYLISSHRWFFDYLNMTDGSYDDSTSPYDDSVGYYHSYNEAVNAGIIAICNHIKDNENTTS